MKSFTNVSVDSIAVLAIAGLADLRKDATCTCDYDGPCWPCLLARALREVKEAGVMIDSIPELRVAGREPDPNA